MFSGFETTYNSIFRRIGWVVEYVRSYCRYSWWYYNSDFFFFCSKFTGVIGALWSNETGKGSLSKVVQRLKYYLYINFHQGRLNTCEVIVIYFNDTYFFCFITSERNLSTLVKVNCLPFISESCSAGSELLTYKFSPR